MHVRRAYDEQFPVNASLADMEMSRKEYEEVGRPDCVMRPLLLASIVAAEVARARLTSYAWCVLELSMSGLVQLALSISADTNLRVPDMEMSRQQYENVGRPV